MKSLNTRKGSEILYKIVQECLRFRNVFASCSVSVYDVLRRCVTCLEYRLWEEIADKDAGDHSRSYRYFEKIILVWEGESVLVRGPELHVGGLHTHNRHTYVEAKWQIWMHSRGKGELIRWLTVYRNFTTNTDVNSKISEATENTFSNFVNQSSTPSVSKTNHKAIDYGIRHLTSGKAAVPDGIQNTVLNIYLLPHLKVTATSYTTFVTNKLGVNLPESCCCLKPDKNHSSLHNWLPIGLLNSLSYLKGYYWKQF
jgi:hypothetical protein